jgi:Mg-chelatase subunit ChlD
MNDDTNSLHPWIEPELEARLTALVLGEASDFERDELERLVAERPELALYRKRLEAMHRMLREVSTGESAEEQGEWKLGAERRERLLAQLSGSIRVPEPKSVAVTKRSPWSISSRFLAVAATIAIIGLMLGLMFPASTGALRSKGGKSQWYDDAYAYETSVHDRERMRRAVDEGWESPVPADAPFAIDGEARETSLADRAIRPPAPTSAPPAPPAEPMVADNSGQIGAMTGTVAIGAGGDIDLRVDPNLPTRISVAASGSTSTNVRVGGDLGGRDDGNRSLAAKPVTSTLGAENTYTGGTEISVGGGTLAIASPEPVAAAPVSGPTVADPEARLAKTGSGMLALNGGTGDLSLGEEIVEFDGFIDHKTKTDAPQSAPSAAGNLNFTGDMQVNGGVEAKVNAAKESLSLGSGGMIASADAKEERESFGNESPAKLDALSRSTVSGVTAGQEGDVSRLRRSVAVEKSMEESLAQGLDLADADRTKDQVIRRELPAAVAETISRGGTVNFGTAVSQIENLEELQKSGDANVALPGLQSDKRMFRFTVQAGSQRTDAEVEIDEPWRLGRAEEVDKSLQDILALTPQVNLVNGEELTTLHASTEVDERFRISTPGSGLSHLDTKRKAILSEVAANWESPTPAALAETSPSAEPFSTFSLHVSDVSFQLAKAALASGKWPEAEKIRIEEFVNAFDYGDPVPSMGERVACRIDQGAHPFLQQRNLVRIALRTAEAGRSSGTPLRLTLLLDSSGSMERPDRRATLTRAVATLAGLLGENDRITLVSFARQPRLVADAVAGNEAMKLAETVAALPSEGGTNLEAALELAFEKAREHQEANAQNRIVLLTDGAANLGDAKAESLGQRVEMMREAGIAFDAAGFGAEGLNDEILEALTRKGDGRYYLLDRPEDAGEAFAEQIAGALRPAAKNVKVQVEFNPDRVKSYKLLGFEKHRLATEDFRNDAVDAAELAAAEAGVAVYQVEPIPGGEGDLGSVSVRFRDLDSGEMIERRWALPHLASAPAADQGGGATHLAIVASQFAAKLAGGPLGDVVDLGELARLAATLPDSPRVDELRTMIEQARGLEGDR